MENRKSTETSVEPIVKYKDILEQFVNSIGSLRSFVSYVEPVLKTKEEEYIQKNMEFTLPFYILAKNKLNPEMYEEQKEELEALEEDLATRFDFTLSSEENSGKLTMNMSYCGLSETIVNKFNEITLIKNQIPILYQSSLLNLVVFFEHLIASLLRIRINDQPKSAGIQNKVLTFEDIRKLGSLKQAEQYLIEEEIEKTMRSSFSDWCKYFNDKMKRKLDFLNGFKDDIIEIIQRRNLFVHNGGIVNNIYISNVSSYYAKKVKCGERLIIDREYLDKAINVIEKAGDLICLDIWKNVDTISEDRVNKVSEIAFKHMKDERWDVASSLYKFLESERKVNSKDMTIFKVNYWLCLKSSDKFDEVKEEICKQDFSDKSIDLQLCLLALKSDEQGFIQLLPKGYPSVVNLYSLMTWPIFKEMRKFKSIKEFIEAKKSEDQKDIGVRLCKTENYNETSDITNKHS